MNRVFIGLPHYGGMEPEAYEGLKLPSKDAYFTVKPQPGSLLCLGFNRLWCMALNSRQECGWTHFAMHHADISADPGWLDTLIEEMERAEVDVCAATIPIKDGRGLTSTARYNLTEKNVSRLSMTELAQLPPTFLSKHLDPDILFINTGLWVCDFRRPWVEQFPGFHIMDNVRKDADGIWRARALSEDWKFSYWCHEQGLRIAATRLVPVSHHGRSKFGNQGVWGDWEKDLGDDPKANEEKKKAL